MSSPDSPYHVLRRLVSLIHNSPLETAQFYASLLHDLFAHELLTGVALDVRYLDAHDHDGNVRTRKVHVDPHLAVHLKAWIHIAAGEHYAAIHLVRDRVYHRPATTHKGKERATTTETDEFVELSTLTLPFDDARTQLEGTDVCLECAMIMAEACQSLDRFEEGRRILHDVHRIVARSSRNPHLCITLAKPTACPTSSALRLAQLSAQSNYQRMERLHVDPPETHTLPDAIHFYELALKDDPWLWEAWRGICDFGGHAQTFAPFSDENADLPMLPFPTDLLPTLPETLPAHRPPSSYATTASSETTTASPRRMSPLPSTSPATKASLLSKHPPSAPQVGAFATPVTTSGTVLGNQPLPPPPPPPPPPPKTQGGKKPAPGRRQAPVVDLNARGYGRLSPSIDDMSFPDLTFSPSNTAAPATSLFPSTAPFTTPGSTAPTRPLELPSIASRLFPGARQPNEASSGVGQPPALKRARNAVGGKSRGATLARNATGRNASGNGLAQRFENLEADKPVRRSSRIMGSHGGKESALTPELFHKAPRSRSRQERDRASDEPLPTSSEDDPPPSRSVAFQLQQQRAADLWLLRIVQRCAAAYNDACHYRCRTAISVLDTLPGQLRRGAWATAVYARCYYELADYRNANASYEHLRRLEPYRLEGMEWYSTVLWHLEDRAGLSVLAQQLMSITREAAEPWMAAGNGFALQGEHEEALRCFKRASGCAPERAYAYTLAAYEALEMDEYERAIAHYQLAVRADVRHYHAWFGLGRVYQKMGKMRFAEYHFQRALEINPSNVVLYCCVGTIVEKRGDLAKALRLYEQALQITPSNKMARFRKVRVMIGMKQYERALPLLEDLSRTCSNEASVMFLLGKLYRLMGDRTRAMRAFIYARDLHPKLAGAITSVMRTGEEEDGDEAEREAEAEAVREGL